MIQGEIYTRSFILDHFLVFPSNNLLSVLFKDRTVLRSLPNLISFLGHLLFSIFITMTVREGLVNPSPLSRTLNHALLCIPILMNQCGPDRSATQHMQMTTSHIHYVCFCFTFHLKHAHPPELIQLFNNLQLFVYELPNLIRRSFLI